MKDIKIRETVKGTIKTIDKAAIASDHMRTSYAKTKERAEEINNAKEGSSEEYAINSMERKGEYIARRGSDAFIARGSRASSQARSHFIRAKENMRRAGEALEIKTKDSKSYNVRKARASAKIKSKKHRKYYGSGAMRRNFIMNRAKRNMAIRSTVRVTRRVAVAVAYSAKAVIAGTKALISAIIAGGWVALVIVIICCLFGAAFYWFGDDSSTDYIPVSPEVEAYTPVIEKYAKEYGISEYVELIKAVMMQESGGNGKDPMQASESGFNKKYPRRPNGITNPDYSVKCGVQALRSVLKQAKVQSPVDIDRIKLALQGYNFGNGYISWTVKKYGGYSKASAEQFSREQAKKHGWSNYGDTEYVDHVLRYYPYGNYSYDIEYTGSGKLGLPIKGMTQKNISSHFGPRSSPGGIGSTYHQGVDIAFPMGTHVLACEKGKVTFQGYKGGFGKCIFITHGKGFVTVYAHLSKIKVSTGQMVLRGQYIGNVGSTGNSTGPHLHLGVQINGKFVNPEKGYVKISK